MSGDFYAILGVPEDASEEEIKKAYRKKARMLHPDVNQKPDALQHFQQLQEAYATLKDPDSRAQYDQRSFFPPPAQSSPSPTPQQQPQPAQERKAWNSSARYDPAYGYVDTDYAHYSKSITIIGIIALIFSSTFLIDFLFARESLNQTIVSVQNKGIITGKVADLEIRLVSTSHDTFEKVITGYELQVGDQIDIKRSLIYGFLKFKRSKEPAYQNAHTPAIITYILSAIVYLAALNAITNKKRPERKFNAGIIAIFFSIVLSFFALFV